MVRTVTPKPAVLNQAKTLRLSRTEARKLCRSDRSPAGAPSSLPSAGEDVGAEFGQAESGGAPGGLVLLVRDATPGLPGMPGFAAASRAHRANGSAGKARSSSSTRKSSRPRNGFSAGSPRYQARSR